MKMQLKNNAKNIKQPNKTFQSNRKYKLNKI